MAFHEVRFPPDDRARLVAAGRSGGPTWSRSRSGHEERNIRWADSRRRYNAGYGIRSRRRPARGDRLLRGAARAAATASAGATGPTASRCAPARDAVGAATRRSAPATGRRRPFQLAKTYGAAFAAVDAARSPSRSRGRCWWRSTGWRRAADWSRRRDDRHRDLRDGAGRRRGGDRGLPVRRAGALRHRPARGRPEPSFDAGEIPAIPLVEVTRMKTLPTTDLAAHLASGATTLCLVLAADADRRRGARLHRPRPGAALRRHDLRARRRASTAARRGRASASPSTISEVSGALSSDADHRGRHPRRPLRRRGGRDLAGQLGDAGAARPAARGHRSARCAREDGVAFAAELRGLAAQARPGAGAASTSALCDADLGDARCGVDLDDPADGAATVTAVARATGSLTCSGPRRLRRRLVRARPARLDRRRQCRARGEVAGAPRRRARRRSELWERDGDSRWRRATRSTVSAGCDKRFATCRAKFDNVVNFRGFPHMPGNDFAPSPMPREGDGARRRRAAASRTSTIGVSRAAIVAEARAWIGTPYRHQASLQGRRLRLPRAACAGSGGRSSATEPEALPAYTRRLGRGDGRRDHARDGQRGTSSSGRRRAAEPGDVLRVPDARRRGEARGGFSRAARAVHPRASRARR